MKDWIPPKSTPPPPAPPAPLRPADTNADEDRAWLLELEAEVERATLAMVRLWVRISDLKKEG